MWSDWLVFCDCGFSVSALWCPLSIPTILLEFFLPWTWGMSSWLLQQSLATAPYFARDRPSWPWTWNSFSWPSCTVQLLLLGDGVAPLGRRPWPRTWGSSSQLLLRRRSLAFSMATPDLGRQVAPLGRASSRTLLNETHIKFYINCDHLHNVYAIFFYIVASYSLLLLFPPSISHLHHIPNQSSR